MTLFFDWNMSATLSSSQSGAQFGVSLSMAGAGDTLAVGAPLIGALHRGSVFVYYNRFDQSNITNGTEFGNTTVLKSSQFSESSTFYGDSRRDYFGWSVAMSNDGTTLAVGTNAKNYVRMFHRPTVSLEFIPVSTLVSVNMQFGRALSMNNNGSRLAVGASEYHEFNGRIFTYDIDMGDTKSWSEYGSLIVGERTGDRFGSALALSGDGKRMAAGARYGSEEGYRCGQVRVFDSAT